MDTDQIFQLILIVVLALYSAFVTFLDYKSQKEYLKKQKNDNSSDN